MTSINMSNHDTAPTVSQRPSAADSARGPSAQLMLEAVVASYIHDISERHSGTRTPKVDEHEGN